MEIALAVTFAADPLLPALQFALHEAGFTAPARGGSVNRDDGVGRQSEGDVLARRGETAG